MINKNLNRVLLLTTILVLVGLDRSLANDKIDSLKNVIAIQDADQAKVDNLLLIAKEYYKNQQMDSASKYAATANEVAFMIDYENGIADALYRLSLIYFRTGDFNRAFENINEFYLIAKKNSDSIRLGKAYWLRGTLYRETGKHQAAKQDYKSSFQIFNNTNDTVRLLSITQSMGNFYFDLSQFDSAAFYYHKTIDLCKAVGNESGLAMVFNQLGKTYATISPQKFDEAKLLIRQSLSINKQYNNLRGIALNYSNLANIALDEDKLDSAMHYYEKVKEINTKTGNAIGLSHYYNNIAEVYEKQGKFNEALKNYRIALSYYHEQNITEGIGVAQANIADIYVKLKQYAKAHQYYDSVIQLAGRHGYLYRKKNALINKSDAYYREGKYKNAFEYHLVFNDLADSIFNLEKAGIVADMMKKYEKEKDQARILELEKQSLEKDLRIRIRTNQRNAYLYIGIVLVLLVILVAFYFRQKAVKERLVADQKIRQLENEKLMLAAKALVEGQEEERKLVAQQLHESLGVLLSSASVQFSSIKGESIESQASIRKATSLIEQATGDVRKISDNMMPELLTNLGLFEAVKELVEKVGDAEGINTSYHIDGNTQRLPENTEIMLYRVLQELVNNTLKHARAKTIHLQMNILADKLEIDYKDDGKGFNIDEKLELKSLGLNSIQSRVNFLNGTSEITSEPGSGVQYNIVVPI